MDSCSDIAEIYVVGTLDLPGNKTTESEQKMLALLWQVLSKL